MSTTDEIRAELTRLGVDWANRDSFNDYKTVWHHDHTSYLFIESIFYSDMAILKVRKPTPEQAIAATLGPTYKPNPVWEKWHKSLRHETVETVGDAVEQLMYEAIEFGGDMGPNGNTCNGIDEGDVLTSGFINEWIARFESTLGRDRYSYEQLREISNAVGDAMEYAHDRAIEHPDRADPLWSLDEYVNRILKVAFEGEATLGATDARPTQAESSGTCHMEQTGHVKVAGVDYYDDDYECSECGAEIFEGYNFCPNCGRKVVTNG